MHIIAKATLPMGATCISYADDIQATTHNKIETALGVTGGICSEMDFVSSISKTNIYSNREMKTDYILNN